MKDFIAEKITIVLDTRYLELYAHLFQVPWACENIITLSSESTAMAFKAYDYYYQEEFSSFVNQIQEKHS
jgi:hypothetical protein